MKRWICREMCFAIWVLVSSLAGCSPSDNAAGDEPAPAETEAGASEVANADTATTLEGTLRRHPDAHTKQSFFTGNYHLHSSDGESHWISASESVSEEDFDKFHEKRVRLTGHMQKGGTWDGSDGTQGPALEPGETWNWPDSLVVETIEPLP